MWIIAALIVLSVLVFWFSAVIVAGTAYHIWKVTNTQLHGELEILYVEVTCMSEQVTQMQANYDSLMEVARKLASAVIDDDGDGDETSDVVPFSPSGGPVPQQPRSPGGLHAFNPSNN